MRSKPAVGLILPWVVNFNITCSLASYGTSIESFILERVGRQIKGQAQVTESHIQVRFRLPGTGDDRSGVCEVVVAGGALGAGRRDGYLVGVRR